MWFLVLGVLSAGLWLIEARPLIACMMRSKPTPRKGIKGVKDRTGQAFDVILAAVASWPVVVDVTITIWLINMLGLGMSTAGAIIGLGISDVIGLVLAVISLKKHKKDHE